MRFTIVNFVYLFYTIVEGFYLSKLLSVTSTSVMNTKTRLKDVNTSGFKIVELLRYFHLQPCFHV